MLSTVRAIKRETKTDGTNKTDEKEKNMDMGGSENKALINEEIGLSYCGNMRELYVEILNVYLDESKIDALNEFYANRNWEDYRIKAHALKSTSLTIGAVELSDEAKALEQAIVNGNIDYVVDNHKEVMEHYQAVLNEVKALLGRCE